MVTPAGERYDEAISGHGAAERLGLIEVQTLVSDDLEIIRQVLHGEIDSFAELIPRYQQHVVKITNRHVPADCVAEGAHDVFVRAYTSLSSFSGQTPFEHWLSGIAIRMCYDFWRARRREELPVSALTAEHQAWVDHVLAAESDDQFRAQARRQEAAELLQWALGHLSAENRLVLTLVHLDGYSRGGRSAGLEPKLSVEQQEELDRLYAKLQRRWQVSRDYMQTTKERLKLMK